MKAIIIKGPQGCGKSVLARHMAATAGGYLVTPMNEITSSSFGLGNVLSAEINTLIFEEVLDKDQHITIAKLLTDGETTEINVKYMPPYKIKTPNIIFVLDSISSMFETEFPDIPVINIAFFGEKNE